LEPETVVLRRLLEEVRRLVELVLAGVVVLGVAGGRLGLRGRRRLVMPQRLAQLRGGELARRLVGERVAVRRRGGLGLGLGPDAVVGRGRVGAMRAVALVGGRRGRGRGLVVLVLEVVVQRR